MAATYYNFMEGTLGLGRNGTHLVHAGVAGAGTFAVGKYAGVEAISSNWWAPIAGAFAGLGLSLTARALLVNDQAEFSLIKSAMERDLKRLEGSISKSEIDEARQLLAQVKVAKEAPGQDPSDHGNILDATGTRG